VNKLTQYYVAGLLCTLLIACDTRSAAPPLTRSVPTHNPASTPVLDTQRGIQRLRLIGEQRLHPFVQVANTRVGGLSSIDYDAQRNVFYLVSDDRGEHGPARFYTARLHFTAEHFSGAEIIGMTPLEVPVITNRRGIVQKSAVDPEALRYDAHRNEIIWASEADGTSPWSTSRVTPFIRTAALDGRKRADFAIDPMFMAGSSNQGPRGNLSFEGLALSADGDSLWVAMEGPLLQDDSPPDIGKGAVVRISRMARQPTSPQPLLAQYAYVLDALPGNSLLDGWPSIQGIAEILELDETRLLVLERGFTSGAGISVRLYEASFATASDIRQVPALLERAIAGHGAPRTAAMNPTTRPIVPMSKRLLLDFSRLGLPHIDNIEGMSWGPRLANGHRSLVFVSDNNFRPIQVNQFLAFEVLP